MKRTSWECYRCDVKFNIELPDNESLDNCPCCGADTCEVHEVIK